MSVKWGLENIGLSRFPAWTIGHLCFNERAFVFALMPIANPLPHSWDELYLYDHFYCPEKSKSNSN